MSMAVATARRGNEVVRLKGLIEMCDHVIRQGPRTPNGIQSEYMAQRVQQAQTERELLVAELAEIEAMDDEALVARFDPKVELPETVSMREIFGRGEYAPARVDVHREPVPVRREGGDPYPVQAESLPEGHEYGKTRYGT